MLNTLLLSGYVGPSSEGIHILFGILAFSVAMGLLLLWRGVRLLLQERAVGWLVVMGAVVLPMLGWHLVVSAF